MNRQAESRYPSRLTWVLKLHVDAVPHALVGRLENIVTARRVDFASGRELLDAIAHELAACEAEPRTDEPASLAAPAQRAAGDAS